MNRPDRASKRKLYLNWISLRAPVVVLVLAATAIPVELRSPAHVSPGFGIQFSDFVANVAGYVPLGIVLAGFGQLRAVIAAVLMATFAETGQFVMVHRNPSVIDVAANLIGAILGTVVAARWGIGSPGLTVNRWTGLAAAALALALGVGVWATSGDALNDRGAGSPGTLEAYWKLDERGGLVALDSSGHGLNGAFTSDVMHVAGIRGGAVRLDGVGQNIAFGHATPFRLVGSMTISAWINSSAFPVDDAAIVSNHNDLGYQLDTTVDRGPRTIGFKLANACGAPVARYGATPLLVGAWYHVAGVYDAAAKTLDVYLNGSLDNGFLRGSVTGTQRSARAPLYIGKRTDSEEFGFAGSIDDVRIYSRALTRAEIVADMRGTVTGFLALQRSTADPAGNDPPSSTGADSPCAGLSDREDARLPGAAAALGVLAAIALVGLWPSGGRLLCLVVGGVAGLLLLPATASTLPPLALWTIPLASLAGGASVAASVRADRRPSIN